MDPELLTGKTNSPAPPSRLSDLRACLVAQWPHPDIGTTLPRKAGWYQQGLVSRYFSTSGGSLASRAVTFGHLSGKFPVILNFMRYEITDRVLQLALAMQGSRVGLSLTDIEGDFGVSRRTAQRMRDAVLRNYPQAEKITDFELWLSIRMIAETALTGLTKDPTNGSLFFGTHTQNLICAKPKANIGNHRFC